MKKKTLNTMMLAAIAAVLAITACNNSPYPGYELGENGIYTKFYKHDEKGVKPKEGDLLKLVVSFKTNKDSVLFDSKKANPSGGNFIEFRLMKSTFKGSLEDGLSSMAVGDSASFLVNADSFFLVTNKAKQIPSYVEKGSMLTVEAKLEKITAKEEVDREEQKRREEQRVMMELRKNEEPKALAKYLEENKITVKPTASGLYYVEKTKGKGPKPTPGSIVKINYTGRLLDGTVFDTSDETIAKQSGVYDKRREPYEAYELPLGQGQVIPGWEEGILLMSAGSKGQLIVPSSLAYGPRGYGPIPPFTTLVFDMELVSVGPPQGAPAMK